jgi:ATP-dependent DNA helicase RecQ
MGAMLDGRDSVVIMPTGGGKSLCYQAPALLKEGLTVVVSPLISLMKDQVDGLVESGVRAAQLNSSLDLMEQREIEEEVRRGAIRLLFVSPERLATPSFRKLLSSVRLAAFAIDEAHCISHWGHDFRPEYRQLRELHTLFPDVSIHAFTATATERVRRDIAEQLALRDPLELVGSFDRPNLTYRIVTRRDELAQIEEVVARHRGEAGIVYCIRRRDVDDITAALQSRGHRVVSYHAGLSPEERSRAQEAFAAESCDLVVATVAFGMGIDRSNVRFVLHVGLPKSIEHYQQETGRAGRDGLEAECVMLYSPADRGTWSRIFSNAPNPGDQKNALQQLDEMDAYCSGTTCRHQRLVEHFGQSLDSTSCGACDVCLGDFTPVDDSLTIAQKILSCIVRMKDAFGAGHLVSVLRGENLAKVRQRQHDELSTFGILAAHSSEELRDWVAQLANQSFVKQEGDRYPVVRITPQGRALLRGEGTVRLTRSSSAHASVQAESGWAGVDRTLFELLRAWRKNEADERDVAPFVIFSDATLRQLAAARPSNVDSMRTLYGIGREKLAAYGEAVLAIVTNYCAREDVATDCAVAPPVERHRPPRRFTPLVGVAFDLFRRGESLESVAEKLERRPGTIGEYLVDFIDTERPASISPWVTDDVYSAILEAAGKVGFDRLKPIRDALGESVSYEEIKIALAHSRVAAATALPQ